MRKALLVFQLILGGTFSACGGDYRQDELNASRALWEQKEPGSFTMRAVRYCYCFFCSQILMTVQDGVITSAEYWPSGLPAPEDRTSCVRLSVNRMFDEIQNALDRDYEQIEVSYDPVHGYPTKSTLRSSLALPDDGSTLVTSLRLPPGSPPDYGDGPSILSVKRADWEQARPPGYRYQLLRTGDLPYAGTAEITVDRTGAISVVYQDNLLDDELAQVTQWDTTVDTLFQVIESAYARYASEVVVTYNAMGYPEDIAIDWFPDQDGDHVEYRILELSGID